jgi:hypothetical protein
MDAAEPFRNGILSYSRYNRFIPLSIEAELVVNCGTVASLPQTDSIAAMPCRDKVPKMDCHLFFTVLTGSSRKDGPCPSLRHMEYNVYHLYEKSGFFVPILHGYNINILLDEYCAFLCVFLKSKHLHRLLKRSTIDYKLI